MFISTAHTYLNVSYFLGLISTRFCLEIVIVWDFNKAIGQGIRK